MIDSDQLSAPPHVRRRPPGDGGRASARTRRDRDVRRGQGQRAEGAQTYRQGDNTLIRPATSVNTSQAPLATTDPRGQGHRHRVPR
jgi:hypothetical protein